MRPPSTSIVVPVTKPFCITNRIPCATSSDVPARLIRWVAVIAASLLCFSSPIQSNIAVSTVPGETTLTRTGAISTAKQRTKFSTDAPTQLNGDWAGLILRAGEPLTSVIAPSSASPHYPRGDNPPARAHKPRIDTSSRA